MSYQSAAEDFPELGLAADASWVNFKNLCKEKGQYNIEDAVVSKLKMDIRAWDKVKDWAGKINSWKHKSIDPRSDLAWINGAERCSPSEGDFDLNIMAMRTLIEWFDAHPDVLAPEQPPNTSA